MRNLKISFSEYKIKKLILKNDAGSKVLHKIRKIPAF